MRDVRNDMKSVFAFLIIGLEITKSTSTKTFPACGRNHPNLGKESNSPWITYALKILQHCTLKSTGQPLTVVKSTDLAKICIDMMFINKFECQYNNLILSDTTWETVTEICLKEGTEFKENYRIKDEFS